MCRPCVEIDGEGGSRAISGCDREGIGDGGAACVSSVDTERINSIRRGRGDIESGEGCGVGQSCVGPVEREIASIRLIGECVRGCDYTCIRHQ